MVSIRSIGMTVLAGGAMLLSAGCGGPSRQERAMAEKDSQLAAARQDKAEMQQREEEYQKNLALAQDTNNKLGEQNKQLAEHTVKMQAENSAKMDSLASQISDLEKKLGSKQADSGMSVSSRETGAIVITVAGTTLFESGKADLKDSSHSTLAKVAQTIKEKYPNNFIRVEGHTDSQPVVRNKDKFADNMELSYARAKSVFDYLTGKCSMPASKMYIAGYAANQPIQFPEKTAADRAKNRRVDIVILPMVKVEKNSLASK